MMINDGKTAGQYNYDSINQVFDFLVQHRLKPFLDLGRRPDTALRSDGKEIFYEEQYIPFASRENWEMMMDDFFCHIVERYGQEEVSGWIFELSRDCIHGDDIPENRLYQDEQYDFSMHGSFCIRPLKAEYRMPDLAGSAVLLQKTGSF